jgi:hypothetical protein
MQNVLLIWDRNPETTHTYGLQLEEGEVLEKVLRLNGHMIDAAEEPIPVDVATWILEQLAGPWAKYEFEYEDMPRGFVFNGAVVISGIFV